MNVYSLDPSVLHALSCAKKITLTLENPSNSKEIDTFFQECRNAFSNTQTLSHGYWTNEKETDHFTAAFKISEASHIEIVVSGSLSKEAIQSLAKHHFGDLKLQKADSYPEILMEGAPIQETLVSIDIASPPATFMTYLDLKDFWENKILQVLLENLSEQTLGRLNAARKASISPMTSTYVGISFECKEDNFLEAIAGILINLEELRGQDSNPRDLAQTQEEFLRKLEHPSFPLPFPSFARDSIEILSDITPKDLRKKAQTLFDNDHLHFFITYPENEKIAIDEVQKVIDQMKMVTNLSFINTSGRDKVSGKGKSGIPQPIEGNPTDLYTKLHIKDSDKRIISSMIDTIANTNVFQLALKEREVQQKGDKINHVHPVRFLGTVFSDPKIKNDMIEIKRSYFKWNGFIGGFSKRMDEEFQRDNVLRYVPGFAASLNIDPEQVKRYVQSQDWDGLVRFLMN